jgi:hypothetical protein
VRVCVVHGRFAAWKCGRCPKPAVWVAEMLDWLCALVLFWGVSNAHVLLAEVYIALAAIQLVWLFFLVAGSPTCSCSVWGGETTPGGWVVDMIAVAVIGPSNCIGDLCGKRQIHYSRSSQLKNNPLPRSCCQRIVTLVSMTSASELQTRSCDSLLKTFNCSNDLPIMVLRYLEGYTV